MLVAKHTQQVNLMASIPLTTQEFVFHHMAHDMKSKFLMKNMTIKDLDMVMLQKLLMDIILLLMATIYQ